MLGLGLNMSSSATQEAGVNRVSPYSNEYAVFLDGTGDIVKIGLTAADLQSLIRSESGFSVSFWMHDDDFAGGGVIWGFTDTASNTQLYSQLIPVGSDVYVANYVKYSDTAAPSSLANVGDISGEWHHFAFTQSMGATSGDQGEFKFYFDGSLVETLSTSTRAKQIATNLSSGVILVLGALRTQSDSVSFHSSCTFDEFAIWDRTLKASHVSSIYNSGVPFDLTTENGAYNLSSDLSAYYRFENNFSDTTGNYSNATTEGDPAIVQSPTPP